MTDEEAAKKRRRRKRKMMLLHFAAASGAVAELDFEDSGNSQYVPLLEDI